MSDNNFFNLLTHLYRSHNMEYGIYFSIMYAKDDIDFMNKFNRSIKPTSEDRIIFYTTLDKILQEVVKIHLEKNLDLDTFIIYLNNGWAYGEIDKNSIILEKIINTPNKLLNIDKFTLHIKSIYPNNDYLNNSQPELICQFPLKTEIFKFFYVNDNQKGGLGGL